MVPYLPVLARSTPPGPFQPSPAVYTFTAGQSEAVERIHVDIEQTLNALYRDNHAKPIRAWANSRGLTYRAQGYGEPIDLGEAAGYLDISECESLGCSEAQFRTASAGVALAGKQLLSSEMLPGGFGNLYGLTPAQVAALANKEYSYGANQMVFHGLPYPTNPPSADGTIVDSSASWPGFHAFSAFIGEAFGPRQPTWTMERDISGYYARTQRVLRAGFPQAGRRRAQPDPRTGARRPSTAPPLLDAGLSYGYVTPGSLRDQRVAGGRLAPEGPAFQGLVVGQRARGRLHRAPHPSHGRRRAHRRRHRCRSAARPWVRRHRGGSRGPGRDRRADLRRDRRQPQRPPGHRGCGRSRGAADRGRSRRRGRGGRHGQGRAPQDRRRRPLRTGEPGHRGRHHDGRPAGPLGNGAVRAGPLDRQGRPVGVFTASRQAHDARGHHRGGIHRARRAGRSPVHRQHGPGRARGVDGRRGCHLERRRG